MGYFTAQVSVVQGQREGLLTEAGAQRKWIREEKNLTGVDTRRRGQWGSSCSAPAGALPPPPLDGLGWSPTQDHSKLPGCGDAVGRRGGACVRTGQSSDHYWTEPNRPHLSSECIRLVAAFDHLRLEASSGELRPHVVKDPGDSGSKEQTLT